MKDIIVTISYNILKVFSIIIVFLESLPYFIWQKLLKRTIIHKLRSSKIIFTCSLSFSKDKFLQAIL